ncbi:NADH-quinone oxidoreductase subunit H, partial [Thiocapsa sp.]|uniref:respiratory chain complex I subunit 1 family protein n=1 Tax=Thiocapsa sp. TaxID=2024551 RepID=UPI0025EA4A8D
MVDILTPSAWLLAVVQALLFPALAPLLVGWVRKVRARLQNRRGASVFQPYRELRKLLFKEARVAHTASPLFRAAPSVVFVATWLAATTVPLLTIDLPTAVVADIIVLAGLLALARVFLALAGMDVGTAFGGMGASREMMIWSLIWRLEAGSVMSARKSRRAWPGLAARSSSVMSGSSAA